ncbi:hypothetical protein BDW42DRAFT_98262 [Aspergillus taichungensis]|uniref:UBA domain-containing protein Ucp14 n=1 Tax=Aspergillus taichungensis TaxID=482145 RepID=A0A2J5HVP9_9EURO|nr:hypothetical protein BDW42DRAFT_98262 [Aspergillus taichungensis]
MQTPNLTHTPLTRTLLIYTIASSALLSILDAKHLASIHIAPHIWLYAQFWRALVWQVAGFANSTEALFAALLVYHLRVVERAWGGRKVATFILSTLPYTTLLPPLLLTTILRPLTLHKLNYLPSGPTATIFALLVQYYVEVPHTVSYRISLSSSSPTSPPTSTSTPSTNTQSTTANPTSNQHQQQESNKETTLLLTDKSPVYLVASQLALSQFPAMFLPALIGWGVGLAWRAEVLPFLGGGGGRRGAAWRVPGWVVGERDVGSRFGSSSGFARSAGEGGGASGYEGLRRRLEGEASAVASASASSAGASGSGSGEGRQRRRD